MSIISCHKDEVVIKYLKNPRQKNKGKIYYKLAKKTKEIKSNKRKGRENKTLK